MEGSSHCKPPRIDFRGEAEILEGTERLVIKCGVKGGREWALNWGIPV